MLYVIAEVASGVAQQAAFSLAHEASRHLTFTRFKGLSLVFSTLFFPSVDFSGCLSEHDVFACAKAEQEDDGLLREKDILMLEKTALGRIFLL